MSLALSENTINEIQKFIRFITGKSINSDCVFNLPSDYCKLKQDKCTGYYHCYYIELTRRV